MRFHCGFLFPIFSPSLETKHTTKEMLADTTHLRICNTTETNNTHLSRCHLLKKKKKKKKKKNGKASGVERV